MLTSLVDKVERVFVIGTPLSRVSNEEWRAAYKVLPSTLCTSSNYPEHSTAERLQTAP